MTLAEIVERLSLKVYAGAGRLDRPLAGAYAGDLLSDVIARGPKDGLWITIQIHPNIVAVALLKDIAAILLANGREPATDTLRRAEDERLPILGSPLSVYELAGRLYELGLHE